MFFYTPAVGSAYGDMQQLRTGVGFGQLVRNVHRWSAHLMVLVVFLHLVRTFFAGAYKKPREFNWVIGVVLLLLTLGLSFTGYLLPWDQLSYWAVTVGTNLVHYVPLVGEHAPEPAHRRRPDRPDHAPALLRPARRRAARAPSSSCSASTSGGCARTASRSSAAVGATGAFEEEATAPSRPAGARRPRPPTLYGGRTRVLGVVDRESVTAEERAVDDTVFTWPHLLVRHVVVALGVAAVVLALGVRVRRAAARARQPEPDARAGQGAVVLRRAPGAAVALRPARRRDPRARSARCSTLVLLPYIDRNPSTVARQRKVAIVDLQRAAGARRRADGHRHVLPRARAGSSSPRGPTGTSSSRRSADGHDPTRVPAHRLEGRRRAPRRRRRLDGVRVAATARRQSSGGGTIELGDAGQLPARDRHLRARGPAVRGQRRDEHLFALSQKCPHLGCRVPFCDSSGRFECPCHGSKFDIGGEWIEGPAPRGMDRYYPHRGRGRRLVVDTSKLTAGPDRGRPPVPHAGQGPELPGEGLSHAP